MGISDRRTVLRAAACLEALRRVENDMDDREARETVENFLDAVIAGRENGVVFPRGRHARTIALASYATRCLLTPQETRSTFGMTVSDFLTDDACQNYLLRFHKFLVGTSASSQTGRKSSVTVL